MTLYPNFMQPAHSGGGSYYAGNPDERVVNQTNENLKRVLGLEVTAHISGDGFHAVSNEAPEGIYNVTYQLVSGEAAKKALLSPTDLGRLGQAMDNVARRRGMAGRICCTNHEIEAAKMTLQAQHARYEIPERILHEDSPDLRLYPVAAEDVEFVKALARDPEVQKGLQMIKARLLPETSAKKAAAAGTGF